jgi:hypothetical protein
MSSIALISANPNDLKTAQTSIPDAGQTSTSFADLLDKTDSGEAKQKKKTQEQHQVYSFAELGMMGVHELVLPPAGGPPPLQQAAQSAKSASVATSTAHASISAAPAAKPASSPLVYVPFMEGETSMDASPVKSAVPGLGSAGQPVRIVTSPFMLPQTIDLLKPTHRTSAPPAPLPADTAKAQAQAAKAPDPVSVVVSGPDQALQIAVRSSGEAPPEVAKLRRLIETTVAHFEMDIAELHVNGASIESVFSLGGGMNGGSAR